MGVRWRAEEILNFARDCSHCTFVFTLEDAEKGTLFILRYHSGGNLGNTLKIPIL